MKEPNGNNRVLLATSKGRHILKCPVCGRPLIVDDGDNKWKLKTRIVIFFGGKTLAKCKYCRSDVEVPISFNHEEVANGFREGTREVDIEPDHN